MEPLVRILGVERFELDETQVLEAGVSSPSQGTGGGWDRGVGPGFGIEFAGWALGRDAPVATVELVQDANVLWETRPNRDYPGVAAPISGEPGAEPEAFYVPASALPLPRDFEVVVRLVFASEKGATRVRLASVRGRRAALETGVEPRMNPLMLTTFSRTGSNLFLRMLSSHPGVVAYRPFQYEPRVSAYWVGVFRELTEPASYRRQITPQGRQPGRGWWLGTGGPMPAPLVDPEIEEGIALDTVNELARNCQARIEAVYARIAAGCSRPGARYFAEKVGPNEVPTILWELYPGAREVFLVRDFRDMIASVLAANARRGALRFGRAAADSDEHFIRRFRRFATNLAASWRRRSDDAHLVRYEDLLRRPRETVEALVDYLGLETPARALEEMTESLHRREPALEGHITSGSPEDSIGRWQRDLPEDLQRVAEEAFAPALELFGYPPA